MVMIIIAVLVLPLILSAQDPCIYNKILFDDGGRSINCLQYYPESHDGFITEGWRRVQLKSTREDLTMPTQCIQHGYCGSHSNVWLNGTHPTVEDGIVDRIGCLSMYSSCCKVQYPIKIKNCKDYMVYYLKKTDGGGERYCFGDSDYCNQKPNPVVNVDETNLEDQSNIEDNHAGSEETAIGKHGLVADYQTDKLVKILARLNELVTILGVSLSITIALLIVLVLGVIYYLRRGRIGREYDLNTKLIKA